MGQEKYGKLYGSVAFGSVSLSVSDPEILTQVLVKDFSNFSDRNLLDFPDKVSKLSLIFQLLH